MTISNAHIAKVSQQNERIAEKRFRKMQLLVDRLDDQGPRRRPEYLVSDSSGPLLVAEVKTIFSGGYLQDRGAHLSTADPNLLGSGVFKAPVDFSRIDDNLRDSVDKYRVVSTDLPEYGGLPLLVVLFFDFFADRFVLYPRHMEEFPEVSGIAKILHDHEIRQVATGMSSDELRQRVRTGSMKGLPPRSKGFLLLENECASIHLPEHFVDRCVTRN